MIQVGASEVDITPAPGLPMWGMPGSPIASGVTWPLCARTVVFGDEGHLAAVVGLDLGALSTPVANELRQVITAGTALAPADVMLACSHTHNAPCAAAVMEEDTNWAYVDLLRARLAEGLHRALDTLLPCRISRGHASAPGWAFNRRSIYRDAEEREHVATFGPRGGSGFVRPEGPQDDEIQALLATDHAGRPVAGIVNWSCHPTVMGGVPVYSADFVGPLVQTLQERFGCVFAYVTGAAGNLSPHPLGPGDPKVKGEDDARRIGRALADRTEQALKDAEPCTGVRLGVARETLSIAQRRPTLEQVRLARWYLEEAPRDMNQVELTRRFTGHDYTFYSNTEYIQRWIARETIGIWDWQRQVGTRELEETLEIHALAIGDVAIVGFPVEYFTEFGLEIKARSPFAATFVAELANGWHGYVPTREAFQRGGYEVRLGYHSRLAEEAGYRMRDTALALLSGLAP